MEERKRLLSVSTTFSLFLEKGARTATLSSPGTPGIILGKPRGFCRAVRGDTTPCARKSRSRGPALHALLKDMENTSPGGAFFKNKTLRAPQHQHKELSRELWALMKRACLNYPTAPGINPSNLQPWSHCSSSSQLQNLGSFRGRLLGFFFPSKQTQRGRSQGSHPDCSATAQVPVSLETRAG